MLVYIFFGAKRGGKSRVWKLKLRRLYIASIICKKWYVLPLHSKQRFSSGISIHFTMNLLTDECFFCLWRFFKQLFVLLTTQLIIKKEVRSSLHFGFSGQLSNNYLNLIALPLSCWTLRLPPDSRQVSTTSDHLSSQLSGLMDTISLKKLWLAYPTIKKDIYYNLFVPKNIMQLVAIHKCDNIKSRENILAQCAWALPWRPYYRI